MAIKPFEIQGSTLTLGGVDLEAGTTGVVIPGVTQATNYRVEEVEDTDDQTYQFAPDSEVVVIDAELYSAIVNENSESGFADYTATTDDEGYIDEIEVNGQGSYNPMSASVAGSTDMYAYVGASSASDRPLVPQDWIQIPFRPKMRAGDVENVGGGGGSGDQLVNPDTDETFAIMDSGDMVFDGPDGGVDRGLVWQYGANNDGLNSGIRQDEGGLTVRAWTEVGDGTYSASVNIVTNQDENQNKWEFDGSGALTFPDGTIQTTAYTGQSGGGGSAPLYIMANVDGNISTSSDGDTWSDSFTTGINIGTVAVGPDKIIYTRSDHNGDGGEGGTTGLYSTASPTEQPTLIQYTDGNPGGALSWNQVQYFAGTTYPWVAVGYQQGITYKYPALAYSTNGVNWNYATFTDNGVYAAQDLEFTDIVLGNGYYLISSRASVDFGGLWATQDLTQAITTANQIALAANFDTVEHWAVGGESPFYGQWHAMTVEDDWWMGSGQDPTSAVNWSDQDMGSAIPNAIFEATGLQGQTLEESTSGQSGGVWMWLTSSGNGHIVHQVNGPVGRVVSLPNPYTSLITDIVRNAAGSGLPTTILLSNDRYIGDGEKVVISGVTNVDASEPGTSAQSYNGTYYIKNNGGTFELYTDQALTTPWDTSTFWPVTQPTNGTLTWSHGEYLDSLGYANGYFYVGNDAEQIFKGTWNNGNNTMSWTQVDEKNNTLAYWNDFAYYIAFGSSGTGDITFDGVKIIGDTTDPDLNAGGIKLIPNLAHEGTGQYVNVYPTMGQDAPHIHMAAGTGGDLLIGDDSHYVDVNHTGDIIIKATTDNSNKVRNLVEQAQSNDWTGSWTSAEWTGTQINFVEVNSSLKRWIIKYLDVSKQTGRTLSINGGATTLTYSSYGVLVDGGFIIYVNETAPGTVVVTDLAAACVMENYVEVSNDTNQVGVISRSGWTVNISAGFESDVNIDAGDDISITAGTKLRSDTTGGQINIAGGDGGIGDHNDIGGTGGSVSIQAGGGGAGSSNYQAGNGGDINIIAGSAGSDNGGGGSGAGELFLESGMGTGTNTGGGIYLRPGSSTSAGSGVVEIQSTSPNSTTHYWQFTNTGTTVLPGAVVKSTVAKTGVVLPTTTGIPSQLSGGMTGLGLADGTYGPFTLGGVTFSVTVAGGGISGYIDISSSTAYTVNDTIGQLTSADLGDTPGQTTNVGVADVVQETPTAIDLTKPINKLSTGVYSLADGVEGQVMYIVPQTGANWNQIDISVANGRVYSNTVTPATVYTNVIYYPFIGMESYGIITLIFTDGAWQSSGGTWD